MKTIYEDDFCTIKETGNENDFIAIIENKTTNLISIEFTNSFNFIEPFNIDENDWIGILNDELGRATLKAIKQDCFTLEENNAVSN